MVNLRVVKVVLVLFGVRQVHTVSPTEWRRFELLEGPMDRFGIGDVAGAGVVAHPVRERHADGVRYSIRQWCCPWIQADDVDHGS